MESLKYWKPQTFDIATFKWRLHERRNKEFIGNGSDKGKATYNFNELGFRGASPKKKGFKTSIAGREFAHYYEFLSIIIARSEKATY